MNEYFLERRAAAIWTAEFLFEWMTQPSWIDSKINGN